MRVCIRICHAIPATGKSVREIMLPGVFLFMGRVNMAGFSVCFIPFQILTDQYIY